MSETSVPSPIVLFLRMLFFSVSTATLCGTSVIEPVKWYTIIVVGIQVTTSHPPSPLPPPPPPPLTSTMTYSLSLPPSSLFSSPSHLSLTSTTTFPSFPLFPPPLPSPLSPHLSLTSTMTYSLSLPPSSLLPSPPSSPPHLSLTSTLSSFPPLPSSPPPLPLISHSHPLNLSFHSSSTLSPHFSLTHTFTLFPSLSPSLPPPQMLTSFVYFTSIMSVALTPRRRSQFEPPSNTTTTRSK